MNTGKTIVVAMLWAVTLWRLPSAFRVPKQRPLTVSFAALTVSVTLSIPDLLRAVDRTAHVHNLGILVAHLVGIVGIAAALEFVVAMARPRLLRTIRKPHAAVIAFAAVALTVLFALVRQPTEVNDFYQAYASSWAAVAYSAIYMGYLGLVMVVGTWLFWTYSRYAGAASLRLGLRVLAAGTGTAAVYTVLRMAQMLIQFSGSPSPFNEGELFAGEWCAIALVLLGSTIPALGVARRYLHDLRSLRRIRPLWTALTAEVPDIVLSPDRRQGLRLRLHRVVIEIRDVSLVLLPYADQSVRGQARLAAQAMQVEDGTLDLVTEALVLRAAHAAKAASRKTSSVATAADEAAPEGIDLADEIRRLSIISDAYHSSAAAAFALEHARTAGTGEAVRQAEAPGRTA